VAQDSDTVLAELVARQEIRDVVARYCRAADRCDAAAMKECFHEDAVDEHGFFSGSALVFAEQAATSLAERFVSTRHVLGNVLISFAGDVAGCEAYVTAVLRRASGREQYDVTFAARYLDRFERRRGVWKIAHRLLVSDGTRVDEVREQDARMDMAVHGARGQADPSHPFFAEFTAMPTISRSETEQ
jgi:ketosteroid isomerase-like protein